MVATIALAGNPNVGKSTLFNALTGTRQHVGNWPGKTVEKKEGRTRIGDRDFAVVDLPGTYSLTAYSPEEIIARDFIVRERPGAVVAVVDASNLERNLYLVVQLLEMEAPLILALNMSDVAHRRGLQIDRDRLSERLGGVPVVETVGIRSAGLDTLRQAISQFTAGPQPTAPVAVDYGEAVEDELTALQARVEAEGALGEQYPPRWLAVKLLENDEDIYAHLEAGGHADLLAAAGKAAARVEAMTGEEAETLIADRRYAFIGRLVGGVVRRPRVLVDETTSDKIDKISAHPVWGMPLFLVAMWLIFQLTANVSTPLLDWVDGVIGGPVTNWAVAILGLLGLGGTWFEALVVDGVIAGVGGVLTFVPVLMFLYFGIALLEDTGYMARAAFVMDRVMGVLGLTGKSFLPMLVGFGCTVPAVYATRTLEDEADRKLIGFLVPFMSCGARLPVYVLFGAAFFGARAGGLVFAMYALGIAAALVTGFVMKRTVFSGKPPAPFVMELPPYRLPAPKDVLLQMWERTAGFLRNAATIIMLTSIVIWFLMAAPARAGVGGFNRVRAEDSLFGAVSRAIAPVFTPAGFGSWEAAGSLITGFVAKEVVVGTMSQVYVGEAGDTVAGEETEAASTFLEDLKDIAVGFGRAVVLTVQEAINIVPRTVSAIPGVRMESANLLGVEEAGEDTTRLQEALRASFTPLSAVAFNVFVLLYVPCMGTVAAMRQEFGWRWTLYQILYTCGLAWLVATLVYQVGGLLV
jgi:ferrous iron transport protein B